MECEALVLHTIGQYFLTFGGVRSRAWKTSLRQYMSLGVKHDARAQMLGDRYLPCVWCKILMPTLVDFHI
jgi:hypothetical protein